MRIEIYGYSGGDEAWARGGARWGARRGRRGLVGGEAWAAWARGGGVGVSGVRLDLEKLKLFLVRSVFLPFGCHNLQALSYCLGHELINIY